MPPDDEQAEFRKPTTRGIDPAVYELFVLGELMVQSLYGYLLHEIANHILGPLSPLSWGVLYPLLTKLEEQGLTTSILEIQLNTFGRKERGQPRRVYMITDAGRARFLKLVNTHDAYSRDTPKLFIIKLTKFQFLTREQRLAVLVWYQGYLAELHTYYRRSQQEITDNPQIVAEERTWIQQSINYQLHRFEAEIAWVNGLMSRVQQDTP